MPQPLWHHAGEQRDLPTVAVVLVDDSIVVIGAWAMAAFSVINLSVAFWLDRDVFLAQKV